MGYGSDNEDGEVLPYNTPDIIPNKPEPKPYTLGVPDHETVLKIATEICQGKLLDTVLPPDQQADWVSAYQEQEKGNNVPAAEEDKVQWELNDQPNEFTPKEDDEVSNDSFVEDDVDFDAHAALSAVTTPNPTAKFDADKLEPFDFSETKVADPLGGYYDKST